MTGAPSEDQPDAELDARALLTRLAAAIAAHDWPALRQVLADDCDIQMLHTGERFDADGYTAFNRDYPGDWRYHADEVVAGGDRGVLRAHTDLAGETFHVAAFATARGGRLTDLTEIWTEAVAPHPERGQP